MLRFRWIKDKSQQNLSKSYELHLVGSDDTRRTLTKCYARGPVRKS